MANLSDANLTDADLNWVYLGGANLERSILVGTTLEGANLTGCSVYGISAWDVKLEGAIQSNLVITREGESPIQVDNLEVAQFIYLLLNNERIRGVIDTITSKVVLILGRFTPERKVVLDAIRDELRKQDYLPVLFDFEKPASKDLTGTISTLANMARFVIADLTDPSSVPHELATLVPSTVVPVQTHHPGRTAAVRDGRRFCDEIPLVPGATPVQVPGTADRSARRNGDCSGGSEGEGARAEVVEERTGLVEHQGGDRRISMRYPPRPAKKRVGNVLRVPRLIS